VSNPYGPQQGRWQQQTGPQDQWWQQGSALPAQPPPQQRRGGRGKTVGLVLGVVALLALVGFFGYYKAQYRTHPHTAARPASSGSAQSTPEAGQTNSPSDGSESARFQLILPDTVDGYDLQPGATTASNTPRRAPSQIGIVDDHVVSGDYKGPDGGFDVDGDWGAIADPGSTLDEFFAYTTRKLEAEPGYIVDGVPQTFTPAGLGDAVMKCVTVAATDNGFEMSYPVCAWADHSTLGEIIPLDEMHLTLDRSAALAAQIRTASRSPAK
jgi:hypothetical protein